MKHIKLILSNEVIVNILKFIAWVLLIIVKITALNVEIKYMYSLQKS